MPQFYMNADEISAARQSISKHLAFKGIHTALSGAFISFPVNDYLDGGITGRDLPASVIALGFMGLSIQRGGFAKTQAAKIRLVNRDALSPRDVEASPNTSLLDRRQDGKINVTIKDIVESKIPSFDLAILFSSFLMFSALRLGISRLSPVIASGGYTARIGSLAIQFIAPLMISAPPARIAYMIFRDIGESVKRLSTPAPQ